MLKLIVLMILLGVVFYGVRRKLVQLQQKHRVKTPPIRTVRDESAQ